MKGSTDEIMKNIFGNVFMLKAISRLHNIRISANDMQLCHYGLLGSFFSPSLA